MMRMIRSAIVPSLAWMTVAATLCCGDTVSAELTLCNLFGDHMVVQRDQPIRVWGWSTPDGDVTVSLADRTATTTVGADGRFETSLDPLPAGGPHELKVSAGDQTVTYSDVLVGEVWICSGQSNMQWAVNQSDDADLEILAADYPNIRMISVPQVGTQTPMKDFEGSWAACTPEVAKDFSAVGYFFGRQLHQTLDVPIGLIDNAWGGSAAEAWINRDTLAADERFSELMDHWQRIESTYDFGRSQTQYEQQQKAWIDGGRQGAPPAQPRDLLSGNSRPANIYNGVLLPTIGYSIRGVIWYQGETNAGRAYQYRDLFPLMIRSWRDEWKQGDFPFYWVQLADFMNEAASPGESGWAELREAQTMTLSAVENGGEAVIIDLGEAADIHPKNKRQVAMRLARWALNRDYGYDIVCASPRYESMRVEGDKILVKFTDVGGGLDTFDVPQMIGFTIAGDDKVFHPAVATLVPGTKDTVQVVSDQVQSPVAVRYAWADNPVCNVQSAEGLPLTPFRTDDFDGVTKNNRKP